MQLSPLAELIGRGVEKAEVVEDYLQLRFDNGACLSIYNEYQITGPDRQARDSDDLAGAFVTEVREKGTHIVLTFSNRLELSIDMSEDGYAGPEALQLTRTGMPTVVWRLDD
jgi:hypothetical protein